jgi:hypothetical protein
MANDDPGRLKNAVLTKFWGEAAVRFRLLAENLAESTDQGPER